MKYLYLLVIVFIFDFSFAKYVEIGKGNVVKTYKVSKMAKDTLWDSHSGMGLVDSFFYGYYAEVHYVDKDGTNKIYVEQLDGEENTWVIPGTPITVYSKRGYFGIIYTTTTIKFNEE